VEVTMKTRSYSNFISFLTVLFLYSNSISNINTILWQKMFGGTNYDDPSSIVVHPDSGYAVLSSYQKLPNSSNLWLLRLNSKGDTMWTRQYGDSARNELPVNLFIIPDGYLLFGTIQGSSTDGNIWLVKCDSKGSKVWEALYKNRKINSSQICKDSSIVMTGQSEKKLFIMKVARNGDTLFFKTFGDTTVNTFGNAIIETNDSGYAVTGQCKISKSKSCAILYRFDSKGDTLWTSSTGSVNGDVANDLFQLTDNSFVIAGSKVPVTSGNPRPFLQMISSGGKLIWEKNMVIDPYTQTIQKLCVLPNKNICAIGTKLKNDGSDVSLQMYNLKGELLVTKDYGNFSGSQSYNYFRDFTVTNDETLVITACTQPINGGQTLVFAIDSHPDETGIAIHHYPAVITRSSHDPNYFSATYNLLGRKLPSIMVNSKCPGSLRITKDSNSNGAAMRLFVK
jgi:hypothetical protein